MLKSLEKAQWQELAVKMNVNYKRCTSTATCILEMTQQSTDFSDLPRNPQGIKPKYIVLIPAAGVGARMAANIPKQYLDLAGKSVLQRTVDCFLSCPQIDQIFVAVSAEDAFLLGGVASTSFLRSDEADTLSATSSASLLTLVQNGAGAVARFFSGVTEVFTILNNGNVGVGQSQLQLACCVVC